MAALEQDSSVLGGPGPSAVLSDSDDDFGPPPTDRTLESGGYDDDDNGLEMDPDSPRALFSEGDLNPGGTFVAELGLLKSLKKPREFGRVEQAGRQLNEIRILKDEDGNHVAPE